MSNRKTELIKKLEGIVEDYKKFQKESRELLGLVILINAM